MGRTNLFRSLNPSAHTVIITAIVKESVRFAYRSAAKNTMPWWAGFVRVTYGISCTFAEDRVPWTYQVRMEGQWFSRRTSIRPRDREKETFIDMERKCYVVDNRTRVHERIGFQKVQRKKRIKYTLYYYNTYGRYFVSLLKIQ